MQVISIIISHIVNYLQLFYINFLSCFLLNHSHIYLLVVDNSPMSFIRIAERESPILEFPIGYMNFVRVNRNLVVADPGDIKVLPDDLASRENLSVLYRHLSYTEPEKTDYGMLVVADDVVLVQKGLVDLRYLEDVMKDTSRWATIKLRSKRIRNRYFVGSVHELWAIANNLRLG